MSSIGDAYYPSDLEGDRKTLPAGRYTASIVGLDLSKNVKFGNYIADVFKPEYLIDRKEHPEYEDYIVRDNGIFRYKEVEGMIYNHKKNWGFAKFISTMKLRKQDREGKQLPFLYLEDIKDSVVLIDVFMKEFMNDLDSEIRYSVARTIQLIKEPSVPF